MAPTDNEGDDPVVAEYEVFITPQMEQQLYLLQYVNRPPDLPFTEAMRSKPTQMRIKPNTGFVEVDIPMNVHQNYDRRKGVQWGEAMRQTKGFGQKAYGMAGGFERIMPRSNNRPGAASESAPPPRPIDEDDRIEDYISNFDDANEKGHVLNTQTWGGKMPRHDPCRPNYMLGAFRENELHLTPVDAIVQLQTQYAHIDATDQLDILRRKRDKEATEGSKLAEARAFLPQVKRQGGGTSAELTQQFLHEASVEQWTRLNFYDEDDPVSYAEYSNRMFHPETASAKHLVASKTNAQLLDAMSTPSSAIGKKLASKRPTTDAIDISDDEDENEEDHEMRKK